MLARVQHASALELLEAHTRPGMSVLDVGCGSGYLAAVLAVAVSASPTLMKRGCVCGALHAVVPLVWDDVDCC